jgi:DNA-binding response OmpR family regulator
MGCVEPQTAKQTIRVLTASVDPHLNRSRAQLLRDHGFDVITSESTDHAREQIQSSTFDVLIFGPTLPPDACWELAKVFRKRNFDGKIVEILPSSEALIKNQPDAVVVSSEEPSKLVGTIRKNLQRTTEDADEKRWKQLCALAAVEADPEKLMLLLEEIDQILDQIESRRTKRLPGHEG